VSQKIDKISNQVIADGSKMTHQKEKFVVILNQSLQSVQIRESKEVDSCQERGEKIRFRSTYSRAVNRANKKT